MGAVEITSASCAAHWLASGMLPSATWIVASALPVFGIGVLVLRGRVSLPAAFLAAAAGQGFMHLALAQGTHADHMHMGDSVWPMVIAHGVGAVATVLVWSLRRRIWDVLVRVGRIRVLSLRRPTFALVARVDRVDAWLLWLGFRRRGPPAWVVF